MPDDLKRNGDRILAREGLSVSEGIRKFYEYLESEQKLPDGIMGDEPSQEKIAAQRLAAAESLIGCLPSDINLEDVRYGRIMHRTRPGIRA